MKEMTVKSLFGSNAGIVWKALNQNGSSNIRNLVKTTSLSREEVFGALGWLGRENKIVVERKGRAMVFSLRAEEAHLRVPAETAKADSAPKAKSKRRKSKPSKRIKKAREVKAPVSQTEKIEEFLLH
jgi:hypothetical protein